MTLHPSQLPSPRHNGHALQEETPAEGAEEILMRAAARAGISFGQAVAAFEVFQEHCTESERADGSVIAARDNEWAYNIEMMLSIKDQYTRHQKSALFMRMADRCMALVFGFPRVAGADNPAGLAEMLKLNKRRIGGQSGKQTVWKCCKYFEEKMKLAPLLGARTEAARERMRQERMKQLNRII